MREIIVDVETTSLTGRIIEIGCVEIFDKIPTSNIFHTYVNTKEQITDESFKITGISNDFLSDKPFFNSIFEDFLRFIQDGVLVAHNSDFDISMINKELALCGQLPLKNKVKDTLKIARKLYPNASNSLDMLCKRFNVSINHRKLHGALKDCHLLSKVYYYLCLENSNLEINLSSDFAPVAFESRENKCTLKQEDIKKYKDFTSKYDLTSYS